MSGLDTRLADAIRAVDPIAESTLIADYVAAVAPLVEEARAEGYKQGWRAGAKAGYETAQGDATNAIKAIGPIPLPSIGSSARLLWYDEAIDAVAKLGKADAPR